MKTKAAYWRKADNSGMIYPLIMTLSQQSNFRLSATLTRNVDPDVLLEALKAAYDRFYMFKVELNNGLFRACFVENFDEPVVTEDNGVALGRINVNANHGFLIKVTYYQKQIIAEFFHGLTDGSGASAFFGYLLSVYVKLTSGLEDIDYFYPKSEEEDEDAYERYLDKKVDKKGTLSSVSQNSAQVKSKFYKHEGLGIISGKCGFDEFKALAKSYNCSVTATLGGFALSAAVGSVSEKDKYLPSVMFPINLRKFFPSETKLNFVCMNNARLTSKEPNTPEEYSRQLHEHLRKTLNAEHLKKAINVTSTLAHAPVVRVIPAFLKRFFIVLGREFVTKTKQTIIVSNLGVFDLPDEVRPMVADVEFVLNTNQRTPLNCAILTYNGQMRITFSRHIASNEIERRFFASLKEKGVECTIRSNYR